MGPLLPRFFLRGEWARRPIRRLIGRGIADTLEDVRVHRRQDFWAGRMSEKGTAVFDLSPPNFAIVGSAMRGEPVLVRRPKVGSYFRAIRLPETHGGKMLLTKICKNRALGNGGGERWLLGNTQHPCNSSVYPYL